MLVEENIIYNADEEPRYEDWSHQTNYAVYRRNRYYHFENLPEDDKEGVRCGRELVAEPLSGPVSTDGKTHPREQFLGMLRTEKGN